MDLTSSNQFYWDLTLKDGRVIPVKPEYADGIKQKLSAKEPLVTSNGVIPFSEVKGFDKTSRHFTTTPLLEEVAQAFNEPMYNDEGDIKARWVKKQVTSGEYSKHYSKIGYRRLNDYNGMVWVAFALPVHIIDLNKVSYCTQEEVSQLTKSSK